MFKFSFGDSDNVADPIIDESQSVNNLLPAEFVSIETLKNLAPRISYTKDSIGIPRRDLFDVRYELMGRDDLTAEENLLLGTEDVRKNVYEGGLKVWEGSNDLLEFLSSREIGASRVMELGCGAGHPISYLFYKAIRGSKSGAFVLADYNPAVLRLLTLPNIVLSWLAATNNEMVGQDHDEIVLSSDLIESMLRDLKSRAIELSFVSGAWSPQFSNLVGTNFDLVLASETIYSLDTVAAFSGVLKHTVTTGIALVAAKKVYFGVGGDIVVFQKLLEERNMKHQIVDERGSVGRVILEVKNNI